MKRLIEILARIDGRGYKAYKELQGGTFEFPLFTLHADHVQGDPFAAPSRLRIRLAQTTAGFPADTYSNPSREVALRDYLIRTACQEAVALTKRTGTGKGGLIALDRPGQEILERSACHVNTDFVELRLFVGLPADGRRILAREAKEILTERLPRLVEKTLLFKSLDQDAVYRHVETSEDADALRDALAGLGLVAFVADGSLLPRRSGVDERPLTEGLEFTSPESMRVEVDLPNKGRITGLGVPEGVTLIVGGGFHGKSTLLRALERGVYNHVPGDGREFVVTVDTAVKIRAEDGRSVTGVDISPFIGELPGGVDTTFFQTPNASGSTSQAANIIEALECGCGLILLDEDTSATNFMIRDRRMQELVKKTHEPITPFVDQVQRLKQDRGVSTIIVMGGSGDYFDVADRVVAMVGFEPREVTDEARAVAKRLPTGRTGEGAAGFGSVLARVPLAASFALRRGAREVSIKTHGTRTIVMGREEIDLAGVEQLVEDGQVRAIGEALVYAKHNYMDDMGDNDMGLARIALRVCEDVRQGSLDRISALNFPSDLVSFRPHELLCAINRLRTLRIKARG